MADEPKDPLVERWLALWKRLGATHASLADDGRALIAAYEGSGRYYHSRKHLEDVLQKLDWAKGALETAGDIDTVPAGFHRERLFDTVELALWYHDAVYDATQKDNEAKSRDMFLNDTAKFGLPESVRIAVARLIDVTAKHRNAASLDEKILCDCDLAILAAPRAEFAAYDANIRKEYAHVTEAAYKLGRRQVLKGFLDHKPLFKTRAFQEKFGPAAERNLSGAAQPLKSWLKGLFGGPSR